MAVFLQLPPNMGGIRFGPFDGLVNLGTDSRRCQIVLDSSQGIYPIHATLAPAPNGVLHFTPASLESKCFVVQSGSPQVWPVQGAVEVHVGDALIVGTPAGPRFQILQADASHVAAAKPGIVASLGSMLPGTRRSGGQSLQQGLANEAQRVAERSMMRNSTFRELSYLYRRFKTGQLFSPVTIIGTLVTVGGMVLAGGVSCTGTLMALWHRFTF